MPFLNPLALPQGGDHSKQSNFHLFSAARTIQDRVRRRLGLLLAYSVPGETEFVTTLGLLCFAFRTIQDRVRHLGVRKLHYPDKKY